MATRKRFYKIELISGGYWFRLKGFIVYEDCGRLVLAAGESDSWFAQGVNVRNLQTWRGAINYDLKHQNDGQVVLELRCSKQPTNGFVVPTSVKRIIKNNSEITN